MAFQLAELFLKFSTRGQELVHAANEQLHAGMQAITQAATAAGEAAKQAFAKAASSATDVKNQIKQVESQLKEARLAASGFGNLTAAQMREAVKDVAALEAKLKTLKAAIPADLGGAALGQLRASLASVAQLGLGKIGGSALGGLDKALAGLQILGGVAGKVFGAMQAGLAKMTEGMQSAGRVGLIAFGALSASLVGFIRAGIQGTYIGEQLSLQMGFLSRNIAGLLRPELEKLISGLRQLIQWFRGLSEAQRANIAHFAEGAAAGLGLLAVLPRLISGFSALASVFKVFGGAAGLSLPLLGQMGAVLVALGGAGMVMQGQWGPLRELMAALKDIFASFARIVAPIAGALANALVPVLRTIAGWMKSLSGDTLSVTVKLLAAVGAFSAMVGIINRVVSAIKTAITALRAWTAAEIIAMSIGGPAAWLKIAAGIAAAGVAIAAVNGMMDQSAAKATGARGEMFKSGGSFENIAETHRRMQISALALTANDDPALREQKRSNTLLEQIRDNTQQRQAVDPHRFDRPGGNAGA